MLILYVFVELRLNTTMLNLIPTEKIIERLRYENPWWITKKIPNTYSSMSKRN